MGATLLCKLIIWSQYMIDHVFFLFFELHTYMLRQMHLWWNQKTTNQGLLGLVKKEYRRLQQNMGWLWAAQGGFFVCELLHEELVAVVDFMVKPK